MVFLTKDEILETVPSFYKRRTVGDYFDLLRYLEAQNIPQTQAAISNLYDDGIEICEINGIFYIDELK